MNNQFAPLELCKKFVEMGMESGSRMYWVATYSHPNRFCEDCHKFRDPETMEIAPHPYSYHLEYDSGYDISAFHPWDIIGNTEQARKNAEILWSSKEETYHSDYHRHKAIDAEDFWAYVEQSIDYNKYENRKLCKSFTGKIEPGDLLSNCEVCGGVGNQTSSLCDIREKWDKRYKGNK